MGSPQWPNWSSASRAWPQGCRLPRAPQGPRWRWGMATRSWSSWSISPNPHANSSLPITRSVRNKEVNLCAFSRIWLDCRRVWRNDTQWHVRDYDIHSPNVNTLSCHVNSGESFLFEVTMARTDSKVRFTAENVTIIHPAGVQFSPHGARGSRTPRTCHQSIPGHTHSYLMASWSV